MIRTRTIVNWTIWSLIGFFVVLFILTHLPATQRYLGSRVGAELSSLTGTKVTVGRVDLGFFNHIIIDDVDVPDQSGLPMLRVSRVAARVDMLALLSGRISVSTAQLFGAHANLSRADSASALNCQFLIDAFSSNDTTSKSAINLHVGSLIVRNSSLSYHQLDAPETPERLNPRHLCLSDISAHVVLKTFRPDSLNLNLKRLTFREHSGLDVRRIAFHLMADPDCLSLVNAILRLPDSQIAVDTLLLSRPFDSLDRPHDIVFASGPTTVALSDFAFLAPQLDGSDLHVSFDGHAVGTTDRVSIDRLLLFDAARNIDLRASAVVTPHRHTLWQADVEQCSFSEQGVVAIKCLVPSLPAVVQRAGSFSLVGHAEGIAGGSSSGTGRLVTDAGALNFDFALSPHLKADLHLVAEQLDLGRLLDNTDLGPLSCDLSLTGSDSTAFNVAGSVSQLDFRHYSYSGITLNGAYHHGTANAHVTSADPYLAADIDGTLHTASSNRHMTLSVDVSRFAPEQLGLTSRFVGTDFAGSIEADIAGSSLDNIVGTIDIDDFVMTDSTGRFAVDNLHVKTGFDDRRHHFIVNGDMGRLELFGRFNWSTLSASVASVVTSKLPSLPFRLPSVSGSAPSTNSFDATLQLTDATLLQKLLGIDLALSAPLSAFASLDDVGHRLRLECSLPAFDYSGSRYEDCRVSIYSPLDSLVCNAFVVKQMNNGRPMQLGLEASAAQNLFYSSLSWDDGQTAEAMRGRINTVTQFYDNVLGKAEAHMRFLPSNIVLGGTEWQVTPSDVVYYDNHLMVDHFSVSHQSQHIIVDGIASDSEADTLSVDLAGVDVGYVLDLVNFHSVSFAGKATGKAFATKLFAKPHVWAALCVDDFLFQEGRMGTLSARAAWNDVLGQIDIHARADDGPGAATLIDGYVSPRRSHIDLAIGGRGTYIDFLHSFTHSFLTGVTGHAYGDIRLEGPLSSMQLTGTLAVQGQATVKALGTTYRLDADSLQLVVDDILLDSVRLSDRNDHIAYLSGGIHHQHLTQLTFDLDIAADNVLSYDQPDSPDDTFYGTVYASGNVDLHGRPGEVVINCNATPLAGTVFTYKVASPDAISDQRFITWRKKGGDVATITSTSPTEPSAQSSDASEETEHTPKAVNSSTDLFLNFLINTSPEATLRLLMDARTGDYITLGGNGVISANYHDKGAFQMFGNYNVQRGTYVITIQNIIKKNFIFQPGGVITFGGNPFDAALSLQAVHTVNGVSLSDLSIGNSFTNNTVRVNCLMNISGQAGAPKVDFDLDMPNVNNEEKQMIRSVMATEQELNQQVLYLLGIGRFYTPQLAEAAGTQQYDQTQLAMQSLLSGTVSTQLNELISQVVKNNDWNFGANISTGNEGWHNAEYEGLVSGRMLSGRMLINGQFGYRDNAVNDNTSFIGDFDIKYLLQPNGNFALKVYNQMNDRYFTRNSLNTQGIGLVMKHDFNSFSDLFRKKRSKADADTVQTVTKNAE